MSCAWGCPKWARPVYDAEGFNQNGYDPTTGLNRDGFAWDPNQEHEEHMLINAAWAEGRPFDEHGYDQDGYDLYGYDRNGLDEDEYGRDGFHSFFGYSKCVLEALKSVP